MARPGITYQDVEEAAIELLRMGTQPTHQGVRELLGRGSFSTIGKYLNEWRTARGLAVAEAFQAPVTPDPVSDAVSKVWRELHEASEQKLATIKAAFEEAAVERQVAMEAAIAQARAEADEANRQLALAQQHAIFLNTHLERERGRVEALQEQLTQQRIAVAAHRRAQHVTAREVVHLRTMLQNLHTDTEQRIVTIRRAAADHARQQHTLAQERYAALDAQRKAEVALAYQQQETLRTTLARQQEEMTALQRTLQQQHAATDKAEVHHHKALERAEKHAEALDERLRAEERQRQTVLVHVDNAVRILSKQADHHQDQMERAVGEMAAVLKSVVQKKKSA